MTLAVKSQPPKCAHLALNMHAWIEEHSEGSAPLVSDLLVAHEEPRDYSTGHYYVDEICSSGAVALRFK